MTLRSLAAAPRRIPDTDETLAAGAFWIRRLAAGTTMRIVDLYGQQAVDFLCYDAADIANRYNAANTIKMNGKLYLEQGSLLYSDNAEEMIFLAEDTVGRHDTIAGCCSAPMNRLRYGVENTPNCRDNFLAALATIGGGPRDIPANANFFMNVPVRPEGQVAIEEGLSQPGDHVDLQLRMDLVVIVSNCPQESNPCAGLKPTPIQVLTWSVV